MSSNDDQDSDAAIEDLYRGRWEAFVSNRDALAKELRGAGHRDSAALVKGLKKPSRAAWALNLAVLESPGTMEMLDAAIRATVAAGSGGDVRAAVAGLRDAIRAFATEAGRLAGEAGQDLEIDALVAALSAVLGKTESFEELRSGRLTDVPEAGGLDLLASLPSLAGSESPAQRRPSDDRATDDSADKKDAKAEKAAARKAEEEAAAALSSARERANQAKQALKEAEAGVRTAEARLREAEEAARKALSLRDEAREEADAADAAVQVAEAALRRLK